jgi:hypothetical protein
MQANLQSERAGMGRRREKRGQRNIYVTVLAARLIKD